MKKYLLFAGHPYYPDGGVSDLIKYSDDISELMRYAEDEIDSYVHSYHEAWAQIVRHSDMKIISTGQRPSYHENKWEWETL